MKYSPHVCLSICLSGSLSVCLSVSHSIFLPSCLHVCFPPRNLFFNLSLLPYVCLLSFHVHFFTLCPSVILLVRPYLSLSIYTFPEHNMIMECWTAMALCLFSLLTNTLALFNHDIIPLVLSLIIWLLLDRLSKTWPSSYWLAGLCIFSES